MLEVIDPGPLTTVQGAGRPDAAALGVPAGGACDEWSLAVANALLGNEAHAPALEMTLAGGTFRALADCALALAGAEMDGRLADGRAVASGSAFRLRAGDELRFSSAAEGSGVRAYLALAGGVDVPDVLGSPSTCLVGGFGGLDGRPLRAGDVVGGRGPDPDGLNGDLAPSLGPGLARATAADGTLRVVRGPHLDVLGEAALATLLAASYTASARGDRQGIRLDGAPIAAGRGSIVSQPMAWGAVQLPPDGLPIVLLADHQTVGGYPVVAVVIAADRPRLGQLGPGDAVRFVEVSLEQAREALAEQRAAIRRLQRLAASARAAGV